MNPEIELIITHLGGALLAGSLVGLERSYHGRPAGFRTHALVCLASALLMLVATHQAQWLDGLAIETVRTDPTRMAQGIMTGIGFLGAGVIFMEGLTVRGLTTAASIWMIAALGILFGIGAFLPATLATIATLLVLATFRMIEHRIPTQSHLRHVLRFPRDATLDEDEIRQLLRDNGFAVANMSYQLIEGGRTFEYQMVIRTFKSANVRRLAEALRHRKDILEYSLSRLGS